MCQEQTALHRFAGSKLLHRNKDPCPRFDRSKQKPLKASACIFGTMTYDDSKKLDAIYPVLHFLESLN